MKMLPFQHVWLQVKRISRLRYSPVKTAYRTQARKGLDLIRRNLPKSVLKRPRTRPSVSLWQKKHLQCVVYLVSLQSLANDVAATASQNKFNFEVIAITTAVLYIGFMYTSWFNVHIMKAFDLTTQTSSV